MTYLGETPIVDGDYTVVKFLETGEFVTPSGVDEATEVLIVGGGGAGGTWVGGGGGAGGVLQLTEVALSGTMTVVVGDGGPNPSANASGADGEDSTFAGETAVGGGGGAWYDYGGNHTGRAGGSGGGGAGGVGTGGAGTTDQGHDGSGGGGANGGGGGGGAGAAGSGTAGGAGITWNGLDVGGGGGGPGPTGSSGGAGGAGGGGHGSDYATNSKTAVDGTANTGGGGGGGWYWDYSSPGGAGGSGIVIIRYRTVGALSDSTLFSSARNDFAVGVTHWLSYMTGGDTVKSVLLNADIVAPDPAVHTTMEDLRSAVVSDDVSLTLSDPVAGVCDAQTIRFTGVTGDTVHGLVIYREDSSSDVSRKLLAWVKFPSTIDPNGGDIEVQWDPDGIFTL